MLQTATEDSCTTPVQKLLLPVHSLSLLHLYSQTGICEIFVSTGHRNQKPFPTEAPSISQKQVSLSLSGCMTGLSALSPITALLSSLCLAGTMATVKVYQSGVAFALYTAVDLSVAYDLVVVDCVLSVIIRCRPCRCRRV